MNSGTLLPNANKYGYPFERRIKEIESYLKSPSGETFRLQVKGAIAPLSIIKIPIELPKYRLSNGRTASLQEEWLAMNLDKSKSYFEDDPELDVVQEIQHEILMKLISEAGLLSYFKDSNNKQLDPIILDENGFVVNGNRRLTCWRHLHYSSPSEYPSYSHIDVVVLPHCDDKEIDNIEANLQIKKDIKANYSWESRAIMMRHKQKLHGYTDSALADMYEMKEGEVKQINAMLNLAGDYLKSRCLENQWSEVRADEEAFRQLFKTAQKSATAGDKELVKSSAFALIDSPEKSGERLYSAIPKIQEHLAKIKSKLAEAFPIVEPASDPKTLELFGTGDEEIDKPDISLPLAVEVQKKENWDKVRSIVVEVINTETELQKEKNNAGYLLKQLSDANSKLQAAVTDGLRSESTTEGVESQLLEIEGRIKIVREWLASNNA